MRQVEINEYKEIILNILSKVDEICREHDLRYSLCMGTLLGAVRHKGYIPWDDDIDIFMPRKDMEILGEIIQSSIPSLIFISPNTSEDTFFPFGKVCAAGTAIEESTFKPINGYGAYIDIFPFDFVPEQPIRRVLYCGYTRSIEKIIQHSAKVRPAYSNDLIRNLSKKIVWIFTRPFDSHALAVYLDRFMARHKVSNLGGCPWDIGTIFRTKDFANLIEFEFEGHSFYGPQNYDKVLRDGYGDYMQLPPEEQRINKHHLVCTINGQ